MTEAWVCTEQNGVINAAGKVNENCGSHTVLGPSKNGPFWTVIHLKGTLSNVVLLTVNNPVDKTKDTSGPLIYPGQFGTNKIGNKTIWVLHNPEQEEQT